MGLATDAVRWLFLGGFPLVLGGFPLGSQRRAHRLTPCRSPRPNVVNLRPPDATEVQVTTCGVAAILAGPVKRLVLRLREGRPTPLPAHPCVTLSPGGTRSPFSQLRASACPGFRAMYLRCKNALRGMAVAATPPRHRAARSSGAPASALRARGRVSSSSGSPRGRPGTGRRPATAGSARRLRGSRDGHLGMASAAR